MENNTNVAYSPKELIAKIISEGERRKALSLSVVGDNETVFECAKKVHKPITFTDQKGYRHSFLIYEHETGLQGVSDMSGASVLPARFPIVEISTYYECLIVGDKNESNNIFHKINRFIFGDERQGWEAFDLNGHSLFNGQRFETKRELYNALDKLTKDFFREEHLISYNYLDSVKVDVVPSFKERVFKKISNVTGRITEFFKNLFETTSEKKGKREG